MFELYSSTLSSEPVPPSGFRWNTPLVFTKNEHTKEHTKVRLECYTED